MHCPGGNATDLIWRVLASSLGISSWTPLKPQHSNPNPLAKQLWCTDFLTPPTPLILPHRLPTFLESFMPLKKWCSIHARCSKSSLKHSIRFCGIFSSLKQNCIAYRSSKVSSRPDCIFEIHQLWQSGFSRVYSNYSCSCSFEPEIIKIGHGHKNIIKCIAITYSNLNMRTFITILMNFKIFLILRSFLMIRIVSFKHFKRFTLHVKMKLVFVDLPTTMEQWQV